MTQPSTAQYSTGLDGTDSGVACGLTYLSLFSGIGGLDLGLDRAGMTCVGQVEIDPFCQRVLAKHWPEVPRHDDVRTAVEWWGARPRPDVVAGGFPCQDISSNGLKAGIDGPQSGLWSAYAAIVRNLRPSYVVVENVPALLARGLDRVLGDLAALGYDAEWQCIRASSLGAPIARQGRERVFVVAYADSGRREGTRLPRRSDWQLVGSAARSRRAIAGVSSAASDHWATEPDVGRVADGIPDRVDRLHALGNAVVPQVAEYVGRLITAMAAEAVAA